MPHGNKCENHPSIVEPVVLAAERNVNVADEPTVVWERRVDVTLSSAMRLSSRHPDLQDRCQLRQKPIGE